MASGVFVARPEQPDAVVSFHGAGGILFSIKPDGEIEFGPAFTTADAASLRFFWECIALWNPDVINRKAQDV